MEGHVQYAEKRLLSVPSVHPQVWTTSDRPNSLYVVERSHTEVLTLHSLLLVWFGNPVGFSGTGEDNASHPNPV